MNRLPQEIIENIIGWTRQICQNDEIFSALGLVNRQFYEAILYTFCFRPGLQPAKLPFRHEGSCTVCSLVNPTFICTKAFYARLHLQAQLSSRHDSRDPSIRQWYHNLKAAGASLTCLLDEPDMLTAKDKLHHDQRFLSVSVSPPFADRVALLLCDTVVNVLQISDPYCLSDWLKHRSNSKLNEAPSSYWRILAAYNLGDLNLVRRLLQDDEFMLELKNSTYGTLSMSLSIAARYGHQAILKYVINEYLSQFPYNKTRVMREACIAGHVECARAIFPVLPNDSKGKQRMTLIYLPSTGKRSRALNHLIWYCGVTWLTGNVRIAKHFRAWAEEVLHSLFDEYVRIKLVKLEDDCDHIIQRFHKTIDNTFIQLHHHVDGSFSTYSCTPLAEASLNETKSDFREFLRDYIATYVTQFLYDEMIMSAAQETGLGALQARTTEFLDLWTRQSRRSRAYTVNFGDVAMRTAIENLRFDNVIFLLRQGIRPPEHLTSVLVYHMQGEEFAGHLRIVRRLLEECSIVRCEEGQEDKKGECQRLQEAVLDVP